MTAPSLRRLLDGFRAAQPDLALWERWPAVSSAEDARSDSFACETTSRLFAASCAEQGVRAGTVTGDDAEHPHADYHAWTRVFLPEGAFDVDWTARQFHNLESPADPAHADLPCPLVWPASDVHPVVGRFRQVAAATA